MSGLTAHLLSECDSSQDFIQCSRCSEAIRSEVYPQHTRDKLCSRMSMIITTVHANYLKCLTALLSSAVENIVHSHYVVVMSVYVI